MADSQSRMIMHLPGRSIRNIFSAPKGTQGTQKELKESSKNAHRAKKGMQVTAKGAHRDFNKGPKGKGIESDGKPAEPHDHAPPGT
jgi:hypothetical protein